MRNRHLALLIKDRHPGSQVVGLAPDSGILDRRGKAKRVGVQVRFDVGNADRLLYPDAGFARVASSLVFHHLSRETKLRALREAFRVLRPGGRVHIANIGRASTTLTRIASPPILLLDGAYRVTDNAAGDIPAFMDEAGSADVDGTESFKTVFGPVCLYRATKPA